LKKLFNTQRNADEEDEEKASSEDSQPQVKHGLDFILKNELEPNMFGAKQKQGKYSHVNQVENSTSGPKHLITQENCPNLALDSGPCRSTCPSKKSASIHKRQ